jgi:hypothetical protein
MKQLFLLLSLVIFSIVHSQAQVQVGFAGVSSPGCFGSGDGTITALAYGGTAPYSFIWNDPFAQTTSTATNLYAGNWCVLVTDALGDTASSCVTISQPYEIVISGTVTHPSCNGGADGMIETSVTGGTPPYSYSWSTGIITPAVTGVFAGTYELLVMDGNGCSVSETFILIEDGVTASISLITNNPCDGPLNLQAVGANGSGNYSYLWSTGETTQNISIADTSVVWVTITDDDDGCSTSATSYLPTVNGVVETYLSGWLNRGFCRWLYPLVSNNGCQTFAGPVTVTLNSSLTIGSISPVPDNVSGNTITWNNITLEAGEQFMPHVEACVPLTVSCGVSLDVQVTADGNTDTHLPLVLCSYDPNDKQVSPVGIGAEGYIMGSEELTYTVRFQNTGTAAATFIHVRDELDEDLDLLSLRVLATSHSMELSIDNRELDFFFDNINLPDSTSDPAGSQGFLIYAIDMLPGLAEGTVIENTANIYFDFNDPVITNTTINTIDNAVGITDASQRPNGFHMYPNPTADEVTITMTDAEGFTVQLHNSMGQLMRSERCAATSLLMEVSELPSGIYLITINDDHQSLQGRLVKY